MRNWFSTSKTPSIKARPTPSSKRLKFEELEIRLAPSATTLTATATTTATTTTAAATAVTNTPSAGANIDGVNYWSLQNAFVDMVKQATLYSLNRSSPGNYVAPTTTASGWPTEDFMVVLQSGGANTAHIYNGTYSISFTGQATVTPDATPGGMVSNVVYNAAANTTTALVTLNASESSSWNFVIDLKNTNGTVSNLKVIRPGYDVNTTQVFTNQFLDQLKQFGTIRFMDFEQTNNNAVTAWSDRAHATDAVQSSSKGAAWEYAIQLANAAHKDIWINIPVGATDDYVTQLAALFKANLDPSLHVYVEYSNELWNGAFSQTQTNLSAAVAAVNTGKSNLALAGETQASNQWDWAARRVAQRTVQISNLFSAVYGPSAINSTVRVVLPGQFANPYWTQQGLTYMENNYGKPSQFIYGIASAPYFNLGNDNNLNTLTVDQIISDLQASALADEAAMPQWAEMATYYNVKSVAYEGGPDTFGGNSIQAKKAAALDPRMESIVSQFLTSWYAAGNSLFNWYYAGASSYDTAYGTWGMTNDPTNLLTPKYLGINDVLNAPAPAITAGTALPGQVSASSYVGSYQTSDPYLRWPYTGETLDYMVNAPAAGTYNLALNYAANVAGGQVQVLVNDQLVKTVGLGVTGSSTDSQGAPNSFADAPSIALNLNAGLNVVRLQIVSSGFTLNQLKFAAAGSTSTNPAPTVAQPAAAVVAGNTAALSVLGADDAGEGSLSYTWSSSGPAAVSFSANGSNAAKTNTATFTQSGTYNLTVTITDANGLSTTSNVSTVVTVSSSTGGSTGGSTSSATPNYSTAMSSTGMTMNGIAAMGPGFLQVTNGASNVAGSAFYSTKVGVSGFSTQFQFQQSYAVGDGLTFAIQNAGANAMGTALGYAGIANSVGLCFHLTDSSGNSVSRLDLMANGIQQGASVDLAAAGLNLHSGDAMKVSADYDGATLKVTITDNVTGKSVTQAFAVNISAAVGGSTAFVGFTGGSGSTYAVQQIQNWVYNPTTATPSNQAPTVAQPAAASAGTVTGTSVNLSALGADAQGESNLSYTWTSTGPAAVAFASNGTNAAKNTTATFSQAGTYTFLVTITDGSGLTTTSTVAVTVQQGATTVTVTPGSVSVPTGGTTQMSAGATDQFGKPMTSAFTWSLASGTGTVSSTGLYTAPSTGTTTAVIKVTSGTVSATATVTVTVPSNTLVNYANGFASTNLQTNGSAALGSGALQLTNGANNVAGSAFYKSKVSVSSFSTQFQFQNSYAQGDGFTFAIQNNAATSLSTAAGGLGIGKVAKSVAVSFRLVDSTGKPASLLGLMVNGVQQGVQLNLANFGIDLHSSDTFSVKITYKNGSLSVSITDTVTGKTATKVYAVNVTSVVGANTAYVGFTGGSSGTGYAVQRIMNWTYGTY